MHSTETITEPLELAWWVEIMTVFPRCSYFFGPFMSAEEADRSKAGYIEDLEQEGSQVMFAQVKWCQPPELTIVEHQVFSKG
ncbi:hypothetical protein WA1_46430 [Scytonema hofmannii PCC 7110]|jgi:hypothetical protein|uniref:DUF1816 domain-containing protein n=1 Tax=Scytonema hofmannii PCC 7110 TaxID=128403 RepID=A0A139WXB1_9CYAN|nr:DUF1816 domain-containing protein [Scytonema hofmannii]KYC37077.1 hypothetical protein WA1_46430 [Scytonema hofmannii PCC 7110]